MARNTIQKTFVSTIVEGYVIRDNQPTHVAYELDRKCGLQNAQNIIRKSEPTFAATNVTEKSVTYKMSFEDFKKYATIQQPTTEN